MNKKFKLEDINIEKSNLPSKICPVCNRPFTWRKKGKKIGKMSSIAVKDVEVTNSLIWFRNDLRINDIQELIQHYQLQVK